MYKDDNKYGVLNDFDLSTIMKPGDRNPNRQGLERTGTLPFMAMELLQNESFDGKVPRRYDHELESFAWVLVWVSTCVVDGEDRERPWLLKEWLGNDNFEVCKSKAWFMRDQRSIPTTPDYMGLSSITESWVDIWDDYQRLAKRRGPLFAEKTNAQHLQALIEACEGCGKVDHIASVPIDATWVYGLADLKFTIPGHIPASAPNFTAVKEQQPLQRSGEGPSPSDGGDMDTSDDDMPPVCERVRSDLGG